MEYFECKNNIVRSTEISKRFSKYIKKHNCYRNIWDLVVSCRLLEKNRSWKVAYGGVQCTENLFAAHAFFFDSATGKVIDPTLPNVEDRYFVAALYNHKEYLKMAEKSMSLDPDSNKELNAIFKDFQEFSLNHNMIVIV